MIKNNKNIEKKINFFLKDATIYGSASIINKSFALITFPLLTRYFSTEGYGVIDFFFVLNSLLVLIFVFGQDSAVARFFYKHPSLKNRKKIISQSLFIQLCLCVIFMLSMFIFSNSLSNFLINIPDSEVYFSLIIINSPFVLLLNFSLNLLKWTFKRNKFIFISTGSVFLNLIILLIGIKIFRIDIKEFFIIHIFSNIFFSIIGVYYIRNWLTFKSGSKFFKNLITYSLPIGVIAILSSFIPNFERWFIANYISISDLGIYAASSRIAGLILIFYFAFQTAWGPFTLSIYKNKNSIFLFNLIIKSFLIFITILIFVISAISFPLINFLASEKFSAGAILVFPLMLGLLFQILGFVFELGITLSMRSYLKIYSFLVFILVSIFSFFILVPLYGLLGVSLGSMIGYFFKLITTTLLANKYFKLYWHFKKIIYFILLVIFLGVTAYLIYFFHSKTIASYVYFLSVLLIFIYGLYFLFSKQERLIILNNLSKLKRL